MLLQLQGIQAGADRYPGEESAFNVYNERPQHGEVLRLLKVVSQGVEVRHIVHHFSEIFAGNLPSCDLLAGLVQFAHQHILLDHDILLVGQL